MADVNEEVFGDLPQTAPEQTGTTEEAPEQQTDDEQWDITLGGEEEAPVEEAESEPAEEPVDDKKQKTEEFYQTKYQTVVGRLKEKFGPEYVDQLLSEQALPSADAPQVNEDELGELERLEHRIVTRLEQRLDARDRAARQAQLQQAYNREYAEAGRAVHELRQAANLNDEQFNQVCNIVNSFGINLKQVGGPSGWATAFGQVASQFIQADHVQSATDWVRAEAEAKMEAAKRVQQPGGSPVGLKEKPKLTQEEKYLQMMKAAGSGSANDEVFG